MKSLLKLPRYQVKCLPLISDFAAPSETPLLTVLTILAQRLILLMRLFDIP